jgi:hypothetical protein
MITATALSNVIVGGQWNNVVSIRFLAKASAPLSAIRLYWVTQNPPGKMGYASGTGGSYSYSLCADNNGVPGSVLAVEQLIVPQPTQNGRGGFPLVCFGPALLKAGGYYHVVVRNIDDNYKENWSSLDFMYSATVLNQTPDVQVLISAQGVAWEPVDGGELAGSPVALFYADGTQQGYPWYQVGANGALLAGTAYGFPASLAT